LRGRPPLRPLALAARRFAREMPMNTPAVVESPLNADERIIRIQLEQIAKAVKAVRPKRTERVVVMIQKGPGASILTLER
jgi:hypothetical protein